MNPYLILSRLSAAVLLLLSLYIPPAVGADPLADSLPSAGEPAAVTDPTSLPEIEQRLAALAREQAVLAQEVERAAGSESSLATRHLIRMREKLEEVGRLLQAQASLAETLAGPVNSYSERLPTDEPSVFLLNLLYEQRASADFVLREKRSNLEAARELLEKLEARSRAARVTLEKSGQENTARNERAARSAAIAVQIQAEQVNLASLELRAAQAEAARGDDFEARIDALRENLARNPGVVDGAPTAILEREHSLQRAQNRAERQLALVELRLATEKQRYANEPQTSGETLAVVEALSGYRDTIGKQIQLTTSELVRLVAQREIWTHWEALLRSNYTREELPAWKELAASQLNDLDLTETQRQGQLADLQIRLESLQTRLSQLPAASPARATLQEDGEALKNLHSDLLSADRLLAADRRLAMRFSDEISAVTGDLSVIEYLALGLQHASELWNFEITTIDDAPFTVGSLTMGLLLFGAGLWASRLGASAVGRVAAKRLKLDPGAVQAMHTFSFYALLIGFTLLALRAVHFPLTAFTFLGGALAIGVGFGSQNVMNNFISGLILMLERPVRAQDVVEVDGSHGVIQKIGPRSTHIRSTDGRHIVVPNSFFLESNVVNWTLSDDLMRTKVSVGVSYGSPTRLVKQLIEDVIKAESLVLNQPAPNVIFEAFGDNALNFDVYFWVKARSPMSVRDVQSRIRFAIDDVFREHNLVIAYPQRDVHLDSAVPLDIRLVEAGKHETGKPDYPIGTG